jgi:hypothetical protein
MPDNARRGVNLREALLVARRLGLAVSVVENTGEMQVRHPVSGRLVRFNARKKSAPRVLTTLLAQVARGARPGGRLGFHPRDGDFRPGGRKFIAALSLGAPRSL